MNDKDKELDNLKELAKLPNAEASEEDLRKIITYIQQIDEVNTDGVPPTYQVGQMSTSLREDLPEPSLNHQEVMAQAPKTFDGHFVVPAIIDKD